MDDDRRQHDSKVFPLTPTHFFSWCRSLLIMMRMVNHQHYWLSEWMSSSSSYRCVINMTCVQTDTRRNCFFLFLFFFSSSYPPPPLSTFFLCVFYSLAFFCFVLDIYYSYSECFLQCARCSILELTYSNLSNKYGSLDVHCQQGRQVEWCMHRDIAIFLFSLASIVTL